jgi:hypothetical protein
MGRERPVEEGMRHVSWTKGCTLLASLVIVTTCLAGCGGSGIPTDASAKDFCSAGDKFSSATKFSDGVTAAEKLHDTGTPKGIPADARDGFELVVGLVTDSKDKSDLQKRYDKLTAKDKKSVAALDDYIQKTC